MTPEDQADLLIRIDERVKNINITVKEINEHRPVCLNELATHKEQLKTHNRMIWGALGTILTTLGGTILIGVKMLFAGSVEP